MFTPLKALPFQFLLFLLFHALLDLQEKMCTAQHEPKHAGGGGLITSELLIHFYTVQLHHVLWWRTHRALSDSTNTKQHPSLMATLRKPNLVSVWKTGGGSYTQKLHVQSCILTTPIWREMSQNLKCDFVQGLFLWWRCYHITIPAKSPFWDRTGSKATLILEDSNHWLQLFITFTSHRAVRNRKQYCSFSCQLSPPSILHFNEELNLK